VKAADHRAEAERLLAEAAAFDARIPAMPEDELTTRKVLAARHLARGRELRAIAHSLLSLKEK
jgi:hypothetical protein